MNEQKRMYYEKQRTCPLVSLSLNCHCYPTMESVRLGRGHKNLISVLFLKKYYSL